jgi:hypothetical protein
LSHYASGVTKPKRAPGERAANNWLRQFGRDLYPSQPAYQLLVRRFGLRDRIFYLTWPILALAGIALVWAASSFPSDQAGAERYALRYCAVFGLIGVWQLGIDELSRRGDRAIVAALPHRVSRGRRVSPRTVVGNWPSALLVGLFVAHAGVAAGFLFVAPGLIAWIYLGAFVEVWAFVILGAARAITRPTLAVDGHSLAIDERLRTQESVGSVATFGTIVGGFLPLTAYLPQSMMTVICLLSALTPVVSLGVTYWPRWRGAPSSYPTHVPQSGPVSW